jgi:hypothetical protein
LSPSGARMNIFSPSPCGAARCAPGGSDRTDARDLRGPCRPSGAVEGPVARRSAAEALTDAAVVIYCDRRCSPMRRHLRPSELVKSRRCKTSLRMGQTISLDYFFAMASPRRLRGVGSSPSFNGRRLSPVVELG